MDSLGKKLPFFGPVLVALVLLIIAPGLFSSATSRGTGTLGQKTSLPAAFPVASARAPVTMNAGPVASLAFPLSHPATPLPRHGQPYGGALTADAALVIDDQTNTILFAKNATTTRPLASLTKLMSALVLLDQPLDWSATTTIQEADLDSSSHQFEAGDTLSIGSIWKIALVASSNSAVTTLVRVSGLSTEKFVGAMNRKAAALRLPSLRFVEPTGLDPGNVGSAADVLKLLQTALAEEQIAKALRLGEYEAVPAGEGGKHHVWNTNWLLTGWIPSSFGQASLVGKTGYIPEAGYNFAMRLNSTHNRALRVVVLGSASNETRFEEARDLVSWVLSTYLWPAQPGYTALAE